MASPFCKLFPVARIARTPYATEKGQPVTTRAFALASILLAATLAAIFIGAIALTPRIAYAAERTAAEAPKATLVPSSVIPSPAAIEDMTQAARQAHQDAKRKAALKTDKTLEYDPALIAAIGNQTADGHMICCPAYACAYGDAIMTGVANNHASYGCGCCTWPGWGGGNSSFRSLGSNSALLREAYDEIAAGRPTVIHVAGSWGEHWICLIGYRNVTNPDDLTLGNFIALDPVYGSEIVASDKYSLYGDFCQHVSDLR